MRLRRALYCLRRATRDKLLPRLLFTDRARGEPRLHRVFYFYRGPGSELLPRDKLRLARREARRWWAEAACLSLPSPERGKRRERERGPRE
eukprot:scaffold186421_cov28-Tisochrysis_lutea.AAC.1